MFEPSIGKELLEVAIEVEGNGRKFYEFSAKVAVEKEVRDIYTYLAGQEREHEDTFRNMLNRLGGYRPAQAYPGEHYQYIKELANSAIFTGERSLSVLAQKTATGAEALWIGIAMEKDSILLYSEVRGLVPPADRDVVDKVINEEQNHLRRLMLLRGKMKA